ncbi:hypothetical protein TRICI_005275 [Trichomonascus ciferrii]|uniref:Uncharacterized protein n=1 Tax=Trichomonascus ciferrii TaxID=44093 RepID=A0A642UU72_9ASCO|nr:hypothetical protein TRICI_005275 [Trichomonascus ciferrii]
MPVFKTFVGPAVPKEIQQIRDARRKEREEEQNAIEERLKQEAEAGKKEDKEDDESSSDDDGFGPLPPPPTAESATEEEEQAALERLKKRSQETAGTSANRTNWLSTALGEKEEPSYDPKTFRRKQSAGLSMSESQTARSKRLADEMMGLSGNQSAKPVKKDEPAEQEPIEPSGPSLLETHRQQKARKTKQNDDDDQFNWEKDIKHAKPSNKKLSEFLDSAKSMNDRFQRKS